MKQVRTNHRLVYIDKNFDNKWKTIKLHNNMFLTVIRTNYKLILITIYSGNERAPVPPIGIFENEEDLKNFINFLQNEFLGDPNNGK